MVFFLAETSELGDNPEGSKSIVKYCVLFGFPLVLIVSAITFFVLKSKKKEKKTQAHSEIVKPKPDKEPSTKKEKTEKKIPKVEVNAQGASVLNKAAKEEPKPGPDTEKDSPAKKEETEKESPKVEVNAQETGGKNPAEKEEEPKPRPDTEKDLQASPEAVVESAKETEEKERVFKEIEEKLKQAVEREFKRREEAREALKIKEKTQTDPIQSPEEKTKEIQKQSYERIELFEAAKQKIEIMASAFIENEYPIRDLDIFLNLSCDLINFKILCEKKNFFIDCYIDISIKDSTITSKFVFENPNAKGSKYFCQKIKIGSENLPEFKKIFKEKLSEIEKNNSAFFIKQERLYALYLKAFNNFFTEDELNKARIDLEKNKALLETVVEQTIIQLLTDLFEEKDLQTKKIEITDKKYYFDPSLRHKVLNKKIYLEIKFNIVYDDTKEQNAEIWVIESVGKGAYIEVTRNNKFQSCRQTEQELTFNDP